jgi:hypothetical protein
MAPRDAIAEVQLRDRERSAFQLGRLQHLLLILEEGVRQGAVEDCTLRDSRAKIINFARDLFPKQNVDDLSAIPSAADRSSMLDRMLRSRYPGRVENAFGLGVLMQVLDLSKGRGWEGREVHLKALSRDRERIWIGNHVLLPDSRSVVEAAKLLYDYAARGEEPPRQKFDAARSSLLQYYAGE